MLAKLAGGQEPEEGAGYGYDEDSELEGDGNTPDAYSEGDAEKYKNAGTGARSVCVGTAQGTAVALPFRVLDRRPCPTLVMKRVDPGVAVQPGRSRR